MDCMFCKKKGHDILFENEYAKAFKDNYPVNIGHTLIVPKSHVENYFELSKEELLAINDLIHKCKTFLEITEKAQGFNIGWNCGSVAGQTVFHAHCHLIPRYINDVKVAKGGIRNFKKPIIEY